MHKWQIQQAKQHFSEIVRFAISDGPQMITHRGEPLAWVISDKEYRELLQHRESIVDFFQRSPHRDSELHIDRRTDRPRSIEL